MPPSGVEELLSLSVLFWRSFVCFVCGSVRVLGCDLPGWRRMDVSAMWIRGESRDVQVVFGLECRECAWGQWRGSGSGGLWWLDRCGCLRWWVD